MFNFERIYIDEICMEEYHNIKGKTVFTTVPWLRYLENSLNCEIIILRISKNNTFVGYFTGIIIKKFFLRICGSPVKGSTTPYMGFDIIDGTNPVEILPEIINILFKQYKCLYIELVDKDILFEDAKNLPYTVIPSSTLELNIERTDEELFKVFKTDCRNFIRQFERRGATIEIAEPNRQFAHEYYLQLIEVFKKQDLVPAYSENKVVYMLESLANTNSLLCLRVRNPEGFCIATSIFVSYNDTFYFWGAASYREFQFHRPNEYMIWFAIKYWRDRGVKVFDMMGIRNYKLKFGPNKVERARIIVTKYTFLIKLRNMLQKLYWLLLGIKGKIFKFKKKLK